jgi:hypothetical protein
MPKFYKIGITLLASLFVIIGIVSIDVGLDENSYQISLKDKVFCIPEDIQNISILDQTNRSLFQVDNADESGGGSFQVVLSPNLVKRSIPTYEIDDGGLLANLTINLKTLSSYELNRRLSGETHQDILRLQNEYEKSDVSYNKKDKTYRISWSQEPPPYIIWHVINKAPDSGLEIPEALSDYYVGYCSRAGGVDGKASNCNFYERYDDYILTVSTSENNLALKKELILFSKNILESWSDACLFKG